LVAIGQSVENSAKYILKCLAAAKTIFQAYFEADYEMTSLAIEALIPNIPYCIVITYIIGCLYHSMHDCIK